MVSTREKLEQTNTSQAKDIGDDIELREWEDIAVNIHHQNKVNTRNANAEPGATLALAEPAPISHTRYQGNPGLGMTGLGLLMLGDTASSDFDVATGPIDAFMEEGEIGAGMHLEDATLDDLLELENDGADQYELCESPNSTKLATFKGFNRPSKPSRIPSPINQPTTPAYPPGLAIAPYPFWLTEGSQRVATPDLDEDEKEVPMRVTEAYVTHSEHLLNYIPSFAPYRVRRISRLRVCWTRVTEDERDDKSVAWN